VSIQSAYFDWLRAALTSASGALAGLSEVRLRPGTVDASEAMAASVRLAASQAVLEQLLRDVQTAPEPSPPVEQPPQPDPPAPTPAPVPVDPPAPPPPPEPPAPEPPPAPAPEPAPPPVEPPAPEPPPPAPAPGPTEPPAPAPAPALPWLRKRKLQLLSLISIEGSEIEGGAYQRGQFHVEWAPAARTVGIRGSNVNTPLTAASYTLTITDQHQAIVYTQTVVRSGRTAQFDVPALPVGPYIVDVAPSDGIETCYPMGVTVWAEGAPPLALMPLVEHSHRAFRTTVGRAEEAVWGVPVEERHSVDYGMVPARFQPTIEPLPPRAAPHFQATPDANLFVCREVVPSRAHEIVRPTLMLPQGYMTTSGVECYHHQDFTAAVPPWPLLDGPRGQGTVTGPMFIQVGRNKKLYVLENGRWVVVSPEGTVRTLIGWRHPGVASNFRSAQHNRELVGDWSAVAAAGGVMGLREPWGHAWDERTLTVDEAAPIPPNETEVPHHVGPVAFIADTGNNRILRVEFSPVSHAVPAKVSIFVAGVDHPWSVIYYKGELFASLRGEHRVAVYDATTGEFKRNFLAGANLGFIDGSAKPRFNINGTREAAYAQPVSFPEGMVLQDGVLWVGSMMQGGAVRGWTIDTPTPTMVREQMVQTDGNTLFMAIALSDGTFYPRGTVFASTWTNNRHGMPWAYLPNGQQVAVQGNLPARGQLFHTGGYGTACAVADGRLYCGQVQEGLLEVSLAIAGEQPMNPIVRDGALQYWREGWRTLCGNNGWGHFGAPLPWGRSAAMDAFLEYAGRRRPAVE
jgi:hypothetical protein